MKMKLVTIIVLALVNVCVCSKILVVFPLPGKSHSILGDSIVKILLDAGHQVTYITAFPKDANPPGLTCIDISSTLDEISANERINVARLATPRPAHHLLNAGTRFIRRALVHPAVQKLLTDTSVTFDVVVAEWFANGLLAPLAAVFDCPLVWYNPTELHWMILRLIDEPSNPAYSLDVQTKVAPTLPFGFWDRLEQIWLRVYLTAWTHYITNYVEIPAYQEIYGPLLQVRGRPLPDYESLLFNGSLLLENMHPPLTQALAVPFNVKYVGGHHVEVPTKALPENLQKLLDNAKNGAIFFSMGSNLKSKDFPERMKQELVEIFGKLEQTVLWKFEENLENLPKNVYILDWAPQTSILNHSNTILFISHGGLLSLIETTYFGVPIIGIPFFGDQFLNVDMAVARGTGLRVDFNNELPSKINESIHKIIENSSYIMNAKSASNIFHKRLTSPQKEIAHWVQIVIDTQGAPHLRSPALKVSTVEKFHLDIVAVILLLLWFLSKVVKVIRVHLTGANQDSDKKQR